MPPETRKRRGTGKQSGSNGAMSKTTRSSNEHISLTCTHCGADFRAEVWCVLDADEHPPAAHAARQGRLNLATCPHCGTNHAARSPLLFHDETARLLVFVAPPGTAEIAWREQAHELHSRLAHALPDAPNRAYLGDMQIAQDMTVLAHVLAKRDRRMQPAEPPDSADSPAAHAAHTNGQPTPQREQTPERGTRSTSRSSPATTPTLSPDMVSVVQRLMAADSPSEFRAIVEHHPSLLEHDTGQALKHVADMAFEQRDYEVATCLAQICQMLQQMRQGDTTRQPLRPSSPGNNHNEQRDQHNEIPGDAYQALLQSRSTEELLNVLHNHPVLLESWVDSRLSQAIDRVVAEEYERLALTLEHRREQLVELRHQLEG